MAPISWGVDERETMPTQQEIKTATFFGVFDQIIVPKCIPCHASTSKEIKLSNYDEVVANIDKIRSEVFVLREMPKRPVSPLTTQELKLLRAWILAKTPQNGVPNSDLLKPTFESIKKFIFDTRCIKCHSGEKPKGDVSFESEEKLITNPLKNILGPCDKDSTIYISLTTGVRGQKQMPPPEKGFARLTEEELAIVLQWIGAYKTDGKHTDMCNEN